MPEEQTGAQAAQTADASAQAAGADTTTSAAQAQAAGDETLSAEAARKLRSEAQNLRKRLKELEDAQLTDAERLKRDAQTANERLTAAQAELLTLKAEKAATEAGAIYPDLVAAKIPSEALGDKKQTDAALADLRKQYPSLFRAPHGSGDGAAGGGRTGGAFDMNQALLKAAGRGG